MMIAGYFLGALALLSTAGLAAWSRVHPEQNNRFVHDAPVMIMYGLGAWLFLPLGWIWSVAYLAVVTLCSLWFIVRVCPHCGCYGVRLCRQSACRVHADGPSVHCAIATRITDKGDPQLFASRFRQNLGVIALGWILPIIGGVAACCQPGKLAYGLALLAVYGLVAFYFVPTAAKPRCGRCLNKTTCPRSCHAKDSSEETPT